MTMSGDPVAPVPPGPPGLAHQEIVCRIVGLGGVGQVVAMYVTLFLGSVGRRARVLLVDGDAYEEKNEARMFVSDFANKASALRADLLGRGLGETVTLLDVPEYVGDGNIGRLIPGGAGETVFLCVDNHATRKLVAEHVERLDDACLVSGGNDGVGPDSSGAMRRGTAGNVQIHVRRGGRDLTPGLTRYHPEIANPADRRPDEQSCAEMLATGSNPQILFTNVTTAAWMMNTWWLHLSDTLDYGEMVFDIGCGRAGPVVMAERAKVEKSKSRNAKTV